MDAHHRLAELTRLFSEPQRARILTALMGGIALPAGELARYSGVTASTVSEHLALLLRGGLLALERHGRFRYYRLADERVACAIESLASLLPGSAKTELRSVASARLARARTCYDHLAGELGVRLTEALVARGVFVDNGLQYQVAPEKLDALRAIRIDAQDRQQSFAALFGKKCLDWSHRRHHVGGPLGTALAQQLLRAGWIKRNPRERALSITARGRGQLEKHFGVSF
jgi:DNA-binding transcriptional ArsR family regulator